MLKEVLLLIVNVLLKTLNSMNNHGINIVIVKHGLVIIQKVQCVHKVLVLVLFVCQTVFLVRMLILVMNVLLVSTGMDYGVK